MGSKCSGVVDEFEPTHVVHLAARTDLRGRHVSDYTANTDRTKLLLAALTGVRFPPRLIRIHTRGLRDRVSAEGRNRSLPS
jgi:hypothetical protein